MGQKIKLFVIILISFFYSATANNTDKTVELYLLKGDTFLVNNSPIIALDFYNEALTTSIKKNDKNGIYNSYSKIGMLYEKISNYNKATENYYKSLKIALKEDNKAKIAESYKNLGNVYILLEKYREAYDFFIKSANIEKQRNNLKGIAANYNNIGEVYRFQGKFEKALEYYQKAIDINLQMNNKYWLAINYENVGTIYHKKGNLKLAFSYYTKALEHSKEINDKEGITSISNNIGKLYYDKLDYDNALEYLTISYNVASKLSSPEYIKDAAKNLSDLYYFLNNYKKAYDFFKIYENNEAKIKKASESKKIEQLETDFKLVKKDTEIEILEQKNKNNKLQLYLLVLLVLFIIISVILMYYRITIKHKKTKDLYIANEQRIEAQKTLAETEIKNIELEKSRLEDVLKYKNKELMNFALHIIHKNDLLVNIKNELKIIHPNDSNISKQIRDLLLKVTQSQSLAEELNQFQENVENANKEFFVKLDEVFPDLTPNERRLAAMLRINLSSKEIASLNNISIKAVEMGRYRLRKKLDLTNNHGLSEFFKNL